MKHWYAYHSQNAMKHPYEDVGRSAFYLSKKAVKNLCIGDIVWVVEGDTKTPANFSLVDCFEYSSSEFPPFKPEYSKFDICITGTSLLSPSISLNRNTEHWFADLHSRFITKQRFFNSIDTQEIIDGFLNVSKIKI
jgi:hypothetical protein